MLEYFKFSWDSKYKQLSLKLSVIKRLHRHTIYFVRGDWGETWRALDKRGHYNMGHVFGIFE